jgi:hypothetical protein
MLRVTPIISYNACATQTHRQTHTGARTHIYSTLASLLPFNDDDRDSCSDSTLDLRESPDVVRIAGFPDADKPKETPLLLLLLRWAAPEPSLLNFADSSLARSDNDDVAAGAVTVLAAGVGLPGGGESPTLGDALDWEDRVCCNCLARATRRFAFATRSTPPRAAARKGSVC